MSARYALNHISRNERKHAWFNICLRKLHFAYVMQQLLSTQQRWNVQMFLPKIVKYCESVW